MITTGASLAACALVACSAHAAPIAELEAGTPISSGGGWLLWSVPVQGGWGLDASHDGLVQTLPVAPRPEPFDVNVGTDSQGGPVAVFSRCTQTPRLSGGPEGNGLLVEPATGSGCRIHQLDLLTGRETELPIPAPSRSSDTTPSEWRGVVTFGRREPRHGRVWQVESWSPRHPHRLATLRHGSFPKRGECRCGRNGPDTGQIEALDRDGTIITFLWDLSGHDVPIDGERELRVDRLSTGRGSLAEWEVGHEACAPAAGPEEIEYEYASAAPVASGGEALVPELITYGCFDHFVTWLEGYRAGARAVRYAVLAKAEIAIAIDRSTLYGLEPTVPNNSGRDFPSCSATWHCLLEASPMPALTHVTRAPHRYHIF